MASSCYTMARTFIFFLLICCAFCAENEKCLQDDDCFSLQSEILGRIDTWINPCADIHSYMCKHHEIRHSRSKPLSHRLSEMEVYFDNLLSSPPNDDDSELLAVEKKLYNSCMQLGNSRSLNVNDYASLKSHLNHSNSESWQDVESKLFSLGFGYSFFDMKVIPHPEHQSKNTILLQPPSLESFNSLRNRMIAVRNFQQFINVTSDYKVQQFFESLKKAKIGLFEQSTNFPEHYTTLGHLKNMKIQSHYSHESVKVKWDRVIHEALDKKNISFDMDSIVLKNPKYFLHLTKLLHDTHNDDIVSAIKSKIVTDSWPYVDWKDADSLDSINKREFCLKETKLYGASRMMVHDWLTILPEDDQRHTSFRESLVIFESIMRAIQDEIALYTSQASAKASHYKRKLHHVIDNLGKYVYEPPYNIYDGLNISWKSHWNNTLEYRKFLASSELELLRNNFEITRPFSFIDLDEPQNRFTLHSIINVAEMHSPNLPKQVHYGTFGVRTAGLIHALLHEDTYNHDYQSMKASTKGLIHPKYSSNVESCISSKLEMDNSVVEIDDSITQVLGLTTAHRALKHDQHSSFHSISNKILAQKHITPDKLFFLAYVQDNCGVGREVINRILSHNQLFDKAFTCNNKAHEDEKSCMLGKLNY